MSVAEHSRPGARDVTLELLSGSRISVTTDGADTVIAIPHDGGGAGRYFRGLFLLAWLGVWAIAWMSAFSSVSNGLERGAVDSFLLFWLAAWTLAGIAVVYALFRTLRPSVPETLRLTSNGVVYDSGVVPMGSSQSGSSSTKEAWSAMYPKRTRVEVDRRRLQSLQLRETDAGNRLTVDIDTRRLEIGRAASEIEREWLYQALVKRYSLRPPSGTSAGA
jgi:hypothetical protein